MGIPASFHHESHQMQPLRHSRLGDSVWELGSTTSSASLTRMVLPRPVIAPISSHLYWVCSQPLPPLSVQPKQKLHLRSCLWSPDHSWCLWGRRPVLRGGHGLPCGGWRYRKAWLKHCPPSLSSCPFWKLRHRYVFCSESCEEMLAGLQRSLPGASPLHVLLPSTTFLQCQDWQNTACTITPVHRKN